MTGMEVCLGDIVTIGRGSSPRPIKDEKYFKDGSIPWVKIADATASGKYIIQTKQFVNEYGASFSRHLKKGSLIISASGTLGTPYFLGIDACIHDGWLYFSDYAGVEPEWLYYKLMTLKEYFNGISYGAAIQNINTDIVRETKIFLPDLEIQTKQVQILKSIDELSKTYEDRIRIYESVLAELYNSWFINFKFPNHEQVEFFDGIPDGWGIQTIDDVCETVGGGTPSTKIDAYWENGDVEWVTPTDITKLKSLILINPEKKITRLGLEKSSAKLVPPNTILMTSRASIGYFGLIDREVCTNQGFISIIPHNEIMRYYLLLNLKSRVSEIDSLASGATFKEISKSTFRKMPIVLPSDEILEKFDQLVRPIISQMRNLEQQNDQLFKLKETLLPRLMSGELDVSKLSSIE
ncbi:restriction endonuclease subunit S [Acinetobacter towneri]|uniref:restriction endonuclease subunit S n=1 Tax=Acinetobacter towneri TaxID=202956 RepID=UPI0029351D5D|nr:restriction endonuclease subunit S [Acinetobacter towneri]WOE27734.1 restriction endonuclease subunit S [Acinetobacter towneri]